MALPPPVTGPGALVADVLSAPPSLVVLALATFVVLALIYAHQPPLPQAMVFAFIPWLVAGAILDVVVTGAGYPGYLVPLLTGPGAYLTAVFLPGLAWAAMLDFSGSRRALPAYHHYVGTMGAGAMVILWAAMLLQVDATDLSRLLLLLIVPVVALLATGLISLTIGLWSPDFLDYTAAVGAFVVFGTLLNGIATATRVAATGATGHTTFSANVRAIVAALAPAGVAGVDLAHLWVPVFLLANVAIGIHVVTRLAPYADESPRAVNAMLGAVGVLAFGLGFDRLLLLVVG